MCTGRLSASVKLSLILFLLGVWSVSAPPATAQDETLTGWFSFTVADYPTESGLASEITYALTEDSGERYELLIDIELMQPLGGPMALNRKRVTVGGEWEEVGPDETEKFWVYSIELAASPSTASPEGTFAPDLFPDEPPPPRSALPDAEADCRRCGSQAWVTILCRFADATDITPHPVSHYEQLTGSSYPGLEHYWREVSYGNMDLTGSVVVGWYNLPHPKSYYASSQPAPRNEDFYDYDLVKTAKDCTAAADADVFFPDFAGFSVVFNQDFDPPITNLARGGNLRLTLDGQRRSWDVTWMTPEYQSQGIWAHEMGHAFGLGHSSAYGGQYDSDWDVMSGGASCLSPDPEYGCIGAHTIAYHKDFLGWIPPTRKYVATPNSTQTITLERLAQPSAEGYLMAQIPIGDSTTNFYTVEARLFAGYDDHNVPDEVVDFLNGLPVGHSGIPAEAVVIHDVDTTREDRLARVVLDVNESTMWTVGEIFTDLENNLQISIDAAYETGYRVTINTNPATFTDCSPSFSSTHHLFAASGGNASVEVAVPRGCEWEITSNSPWIRITTSNSPWWTTSGRGPSGVRYTVAANTSPDARTGTLTVGEQTFTVVQAGVNGNLFEDDMESMGSGDLDSWQGWAPWARTTESARSGTYAWTDSPAGHYQNNVDTVLWSPHSRAIDLTKLTTATLTFWHRYDFASGDAGEVWVADGGSTQWPPLRRFTGTQSTWQQVKLDLTPFVGKRIGLAFRVLSDANETADGWTIDDVTVFSTDFEMPPPPPARLENPSAGSAQSGIGIISGWACHAHEIVIELAGTPVQAAYGTPRGDTRPVCGDSNNGFSLLVNWNNLGPGEHPVRALADGVEFARTTVRVTTFGVEFLRGVSATFPLLDFPYPGDTTVVQWDESQQNFVITNGPPGKGGGYNRVAGLQAVLENPSLGSAQSGIGIISGWACAAREVVIELAGTPVQAAYGTPRVDTEPVCGDSNNGFGLLVNWNNLGAGTHTVRALIDGVEFANTTVRVTTFGVEFLRGVYGTRYTFLNFPHPGDATTLRWEEALQNFVIVP